MAHYAAGNTSEYYNVIGKTGFVEIFNHTNFDNDRYKTRSGTTVDVNALIKSLKSFSTIVHIHNDYTVREIEDRINALSTDTSFSDAAFIMLIFLTYGEKDDHLVARDAIYPFDNLIKIFAEEIKPFVGIPKIFLVNASRGDAYDAGVKLSITNSDRTFISHTGIIAESQTKIPNYSLNDLAKSYNGNRGSTTILIPKYADLLICSSTYKGFFSFRNDKGSFFIQAFCSILNQHSNEIVNIFDILLKTSHEVALRNTDAYGELNEKKQIPVFTSTLRKTLLLIPNKLQPTKIDDNDKPHRDVVDRSVVID